MNNSMLILPLLGLAWLAGCATESAALDADDSEVKMALEDCPPAVQAALKREAGGGTIKSIYREKEGWRETYSADVMVDGQKRAVNVSSDGRLVGHPEE